MPARILEPTSAALEESARVLAEGGLVAFPTETVYGLGANALDPAAVGRIFTAKGRPADNPVIVHVDDVAAARRLAHDWPSDAERLAAAHWPGPLTLVVERAQEVPEVVTGGGGTVGLRVPDHPAALALLRAAALPIAAPSANRSESISPTTAQHVADSLGAFVEDLIVLDGGPCEVGIESTVVDVTGAAPRVLRPGHLRIETASETADPVPDSGPARSPGQRARHYAPSKPLHLIDADRVEEELREGDVVLRLPADPDEAGTRLYAELRRLEADASVTRILVVRPPGAPAWEAIRDRLQRAAAD